MKSLFVKKLIVTMVVTSIVVVALHFLLPDIQVHKLTPEEVKLVENDDSIILVE